MTDRRTFNLQHDLALLEAECKRIGDVALIIIDPVSSYLGKTDSHKNAEVRGVLEPIGEFAERMDVAILSITHFSKAGVGSATKALHRFIGSIAFVGAPRIALAVLEEDGRRLLLHAKNNLAPPPRGLAYSIEEKLSQGIVSSHVAWEGEHVDMLADDAMQQDRGRQAPRLERAEKHCERFWPVAPSSSQRLRTRRLTVAALPGQLCVEPKTSWASSRKKRAWQVDGSGSFQSRLLFSERLQQISKAFRACSKVLT